MAGFPLDAYPGACYLESFHDANAVSPLFHDRLRPGELTSRDLFDTQAGAGASGECQPPPVENIDVPKSKQTDVPKRKRRGQQRGRGASPEARDSAEEEGGGESKRARLHPADSSPFAARSAASDDVVASPRAKPEMRSRARCFLSLLERADPDSFDAVAETLFTPATQLVDSSSGDLLPAADSHDDRMERLDFCLELLQSARHAALHSAASPGISDAEEEQSDEPTSLGPHRAAAEASPALTSSQSESSGRGGCTTRISDEDCLTRKMAV
jgi:hypothetical protein